MVYNINLKKFAFFKTIGGVFVLAGGTFFLIFGWFVFSSISKKNAMDSEVYASHIEWIEHYDSKKHSVTYSPIYHYVVDDKIYTCESSLSSNNTSSEGIVYYDSKNPAKCITDFESGNSWIMLIFLGIPLIFVVVGGFFLKAHFNHLKKLKNLGKYGVLVKGVPYQIDNSNVLINKHPVMCFRVVFTFPNGITKTLTSEPVYNDALQDHDGRCDLLYDPNDYSNYCIDLEISTTGNGQPNIIYYEQTQQFHNNDINYYSYENNF